MYESLDNINYQWSSQTEKSVASLGLKSVPTVRRHNNAKKFTDFIEFSRKLRLAVFFYRLKQRSTTGEVDNTDQDQRNNQHEHVEYDYDNNKPWTKKSKFKPVPGQSEALEEFLLEVENFLLSP